MRRAPLWLLLVFFLSGASALIYQVTWQRVLFTIIGIDTASVTIVVTAFLLGLGLGNWVGGRLARRFHPLVLFGLFELGIGAFGFFSLKLFRGMEHLTLHLDRVSTGALVLGLVLIPTLLMGATLPLLATWLARASGNIGQSLGLLAFVNTLGAALSSLLTAHYGLATLGLTNTVRLAAGLNTALAVIVVVATMKERRVAEAQTEMPAAIEPLPFPWRASLLAFLSGFVSLSFEIVWARAHGFCTAAVSHAFGELLGAYLVGIALGSLLARRWCSSTRTGNDRTRAVSALGIAFIVSGLLGLVLLPLVGLTLASLGRTHIVWLYALAAIGLGTGFPLVAHAGAALDRNLGRRLGWLGLINILGCTAGSLSTGFLLLDHCSLGTAASITAALTLAAAGLVFGFQRQWGRSAVGVVLAAVALLAGPRLHRGLLERLQMDHPPGETFAETLEGKSGIITVTEDGRVFGGGAYDGGFFVDPIADKNGIARAYALTTLHPTAKTALMIGLGSGAWAEVVAHFEGLEELVVVEINPGYLDLIARHEVVAGLLTNAKVKLLVDDGRRYLKRHDQRFDLIVQNTTHHWRAHATNLISREHLELVKSRLAPGGIFCQNSTSSDDVLRTMLEAFPAVVRFRSFVYGSERMMDPNAGSAGRLFDFRLGTKVPLPKGNPAAEARVREILGGGDWESTAALQQRLRDRVVITDDNMATEWWHTRRPSRPLR